MENGERCIQFSFYNKKSQHEGKRSAIIDISNLLSTNNATFPSPAELYICYFSFSWMLTQFLVPVDESAKSTFYSIVFELSICNLLENIIYLRSLLDKG